MADGERFGVKRAGRSALRIQLFAAALRRLAAFRHRRLVLVYHRVGPADPDEATLVPTVRPESFRRHVEVLMEVGQIVELTELLEERSEGGGPRFALTFDDDYLTHVQHALPILKEVDVPATFFLSGRLLHGVGPYWFESLERMMAVHGTSSVAARLGMPDAEASALVLACENDPTLQRALESEVTDATGLLEAEDIASLARSGMAIGFHTLHHRVLTGLDDEDVRAALQHGRDELATIAGHPLVLFAYPHGRADRRTAAMVREAGYVAAWTGRPDPMTPRDDNYLLGRWEPGSLDVSKFLVDVTIRLNRRSGHR